ncbi:hypothetical protein CEUSTIGMA_g5808.t1 [Chlamydomonas eustigma]|uniref:Uncharacterized protein n=1 Tax=Chlamydomonas eustigma TaxID=1157962 RepID=A0A250X5P9_9CHLO|nr:hypothetical protein CEUSTIGMA_g5808.t1 [Chlamydomonas eustigma]|eukprot:GAX78366.1 hypothetical protein CEUSTIGMA_g5808.t1 [Chlamydomonas eustigma]
MTDVMESGMTIMPSMMSYKDRLSLKDKSAFEYTNLYTNSASLPVWARLFTDGTVRHARTRSARPYREGGNVPSQQGTLSGFVTNSTCPSATFTPTQSFKTGFSTDPVESMHPLVAKSYKQKFPIDFLISIRPDAETMNQTLRMLGTYRTDYEHAERFSTFIPSGCPGGPQSFHPDVNLTQRHPQMHPGWTTSAERFGFSSKVSGRMGNRSNGKLIRPQTAVPSSHTENGHRSVNNLPARGSPTQQALPQHARKTQHSRPHSARS